MALVRTIARPLLAATFVMGGLDAVRHPDGKIPAAERVVGELTDKVPGISNTRQVVQVDGAVKVIAGTLLACGKLPRLSALALAASLVPTTLAGHRFWEKQDPAARTADRLHFSKNAGLLGGLLLAAVDTHGKPSLAWRARRAAAAAADSVQGAANTLGDKVSELS